MHAVRARLKSGNNFCFGFQQFLKTGFHHIGWHVFFGQFHKAGLVSGFGNHEFVVEFLQTFVRNVFPEQFKTFAAAGFD